MTGGEQNRGRGGIGRTDPGRGCRAATGVGDLKGCSGRAGQGAAAEGKEKRKRRRFAWTRGWPAPGLLEAPPFGLAGISEVTLGEFPGADRQREEILVLLQRFGYGGAIGDDEIPFTQASLGKKVAGSAAEDPDVENLTVYFQIRRVQRRLFVHIIPRQAHILIILPEQDSKK
ncbi:MAG: hypothetical protein A2075_22250 [Geobacteraceae bacterium GWC2_58_44]|nr:MAG: hypothetical protein A2075_22250 [Geobacteraceae bacterium GWC2_58_44]